MAKIDETHVRIRVSALVRRDDGRICLVRHRKDDRRYWLLPGGGQHVFESVEDAARRELEEEVLVSVRGFRFLGARESWTRKENRHILFLILEGLSPDFSRMGIGKDPRVEGIDFMNADEVRGKPVYPAMGEDLLRLFRGESIESFKTLAWVP